MKERINVVWLKRDLRTQDHIPLHEAENSHLPYLIIYLFEPEILKHPDCSDRHLKFIYHSILSINEFLSGHNHHVEMFYGGALKVFEFLMEVFDIQNVLSYQESGTMITYQRDLKVKKLFRKNGVYWKEFQRDGIIRGIKNRNGWDKSWYATMSGQSLKNEYHSDRSVHFKNPFILPDSLLQQLENYPNEFQPPGEKNAWRYLRSFTKERGFKYHIHISKPLEGRTSCSRLSPYLAWGNVSIRQAYQFVKKHLNYSDNKKAFSAFLTRLKWHCHFIQKFEVECEYETTCINRGYELLEHTTNADALEAWKNGKTGFPLVDACMRCVKETGWLNFRMRAMVVSFLCHHLDQDWKDGAYYLAQQFLDYEPGIHYPQFQMQAGTTGVNTIRIYNPVKQSKDHDSDGEFIKKWIPELRNTSAAHIHEPWKMTKMEQNMAGINIGEDYPMPIVNLEESAKKAKAKVWGHRSHPKVIEETNRILGLHTNRRSGKD